jgi:hypothetical protein
MKGNIQVCEVNENILKEGNTIANSGKFLSGQPPPRERKELNDGGNN